MKKEDLEVVLGSQASFLKRGLWRSYNLFFDRLTRRGTRFVDGEAKNINYIDCYMSFTHVNAGGKSRISLLFRSLLVVYLLHLVH